ncbi:MULTISPECIES: NACHT domain-containing protein [Amycolatopsis]|uniref:NACHT domain-containing protein n=1 Tax=Amycolatopsis tucumanensis TaxID=401106 RepID=A0ABP7JT95_9PSEU|nr:pentapeptide repeat-containing protein [Amycolatopsis tucumanensis]MCF6427184.1 pentapeptide repeat-containing protein [Amycolatopsis tucumanensis]
MVELGTVVKVLASVGAKPALERAKRQEKVVATLRRFGLGPKTPPPDFDGVYIYTLIEYCYAQPEPVIRFFQNEYIRQAFRRSFETGDPSYLDREAEGIIEWNNETGELGRMDYDFRREFAGFTAVFNTLVDRCRTAAEARSERKLDDLQHQLRDLRDQLHKLPSLNEVRELIITPQERKPSVVIENLANSLHGWFEAIGYNIETDDLPSDGDEFNWIINVPTRRRYDRVVILGTSGEARVSDVERLVTLVEQKRAHEGWLVVPRRISEAAQLAASKTDGLITCYTLDTLIDEGADFEPYLSWLDQEVKRRGIDVKYVPLYCRKEEFDSSNKHSKAVSVYGKDRGGLAGYVRNWLADPSKEHLSILGEFGTGKSWFCLRLAWEIAQQYREARALGLPRPRLPLLVPLRDYAKAVNVESLFSEFFFRKHEVDLRGYSAFQYLNRTGRLLLIFDGFDEMAARVDRQAMVNNFWELARVVEPDAKVLLTCRTEHFPEDKESRDLLSARLKASTQSLTGEPPQFEVVDLIPFDKEQVREVLSHLADKKTVDVVMSNSELLDLMRRPVMSEIVLDALPEISEGSAIDLARVYLYAVRRKMSRDIQAERTFTAMADKLFFLCELAWEMLVTNTMSMNYRAFPDRIRTCFGKVVQEQKDLDHWHYDMLGQSMLIRNAEGDYTPAHRSLLEFFAAYKLAAELGILHPDFLEMATEADNNVATEITASWSSYFNKEPSTRRFEKIVKFESEDIRRLSTTFGIRKLDSAVRDLMVPMIHADLAAKRLLDLILDTRHEEAESTGYTGGNAATVLARIDRTALRGQDLHGVDLRGAELDLRKNQQCDLTNANLRHADLRETDLENVIFIGADLTGSNLERCWYIGRENASPLSLAVEYKNGGRFYVGLSTGGVLRWENGDLSGAVEKVLTYDASIFEMELIKGVSRLAAFADNGLLIVNIESRTIDCQFEDATGYAPLYLQNYDGFVIQRPQVADPDQANTTLYDRSTLEEVTKFDAPAIAALGYYVEELDRTIFDDDEGNLLTAECKDGNIEFAVRGKIDFESAFGSTNLDVILAGSLILGAQVERDKLTVAAFELDGTLYRKFELNALAPETEFHFGFIGRRWGIRADNALILSAGDSLRAFAADSGSSIWCDSDAIEVQDMVLLPDKSRFMSVSRYGEVAIRSVLTGEVISRTSTAAGFAGARFSRNSGLSDPVLRAIELGGAVIVDN